MNGGKPALPLLELFSPDELHDAIARAAIARHTRDVEAFRQANDVETHVAMRSVRMPDGSHGMVASAAIVPRPARPAPVSDTPAPDKREK